MSAEKPTGSELLIQLLQSSKGAPQAMRDAADQLSDATETIESAATAVAELALDPRVQSAINLLKKLSTT